MESLIGGFVSEYGGEIGRLTAEHMRLTVLSVGAAIAVSVPTAIAITRTERAAAPVMAFASIIQTIPSLALFGLAIPLLMALGLPIIGLVPAFLALFLYALLPILRNTFTGINQIDPAIREAARGIGMTRRQMLFRIELPLAMPVIMAGIRTSTVISVGIATLAALIGAGGLGDLIFRGLRTVNFKLMLAGAVPAAVLALILDNLLGAVERWLTPRGLRLERKRKGTG